MVTADSEFQDLHWLLDVIQSTDIGIVVLDRNFNVEVFNRFMQVHSGIIPENAVDSNFFSLFPYLDNDWFKRRVESVFDLGIPVYTSWEEREHVFEFPLDLPIHYNIEGMYQNTTFTPLRDARNEVARVALIVYDVTSSAINSTALESAKENILTMSRKDALTSLWNRGYWEERFNEEFQRNKRRDGLQALVMLDIDHFKKINDNYGHQVGDEAIRELSRLLQETCRETDICGRYGGEEFVVLLTGTGLDGAEIFCERLRVAIESNVVHSEGHSFSYTVSMGLCMWSDSLENPMEWLVLADKALYKSKNGGRNQTSIHVSQAL